MKKYEVVLRYFKSGIVFANSEEEALKRAHEGSWFEEDRITAEPGGDEVYEVEEYKG